MSTGDSARRRAAAAIPTFAADDTYVASKPGGERDAPAPEPGGLLGRYMVISQLGTGAMGVVYAAFDPELDRKVAIKLLRHRDDELQRARKRLQREAQALAKLAHPNVVGVHDVGVYEGQVFVAMEFVQGKTLREWLAEVEEPRPWTEILEVFMAAGRGLAAAHDNGLVHRDMKPENVMLGADGRVRVMDFGLAQRDEIGSGDDSTELDAIEADAMELAVERLTMTGVLMGTPAYMALEQFQGGTVDARSDQFGFCVALYEALYGERPFEGETMGPLVKALVDEELKPPPRGTRVPTWLRDVIKRGLAKSPDMRFATMHELLAALADDPIARRRRWAIRGGIAIALVGSAIGMGMLGTTVEEQGVQLEDKDKKLEERNAELIEQRDLATSELRKQQGLRASMLARSPGTELAALRLAVEAVQDPTARLPEPVFTGLVGSVMSVEAGLALEGHEGKVHAVAVHPDGSQLATASADATVRLWDASSGALLQTLEGHREAVHAVVFSRDGSMLVTASQDETARVWDAATGKERSVLRHETALQGVALSPYGDRLATAGNDGAIRVWDLAKGESVFAIEHDAPARAVAWSPDGEQLASASFDGTAKVWSARDGAALTSFAGHAGAKVHAVAWSPDGTRVLSGAEDGFARVWDAASGQEVAAFSHGESVIAVVFSADGHYVASGTFDDGAAHLWEVESKGLIRSFRHGPYPVAGVAWSPDGTKLATASWDGTGKSWELRASPALRVLEGHRQEVEAVAASRDGSRIATASGDDTARLWDAKTGAVVAELTGHTHDASAVAFAPSGDLLATASWDGNARLWDATSGAFRRTLTGHDGRVLAVAFSADGSRVATASADETVRLWNVATGELEWTLDHDSAVRDLAFSPDDTHLLTVSATGTAQTWMSATGEARPLFYEGVVNAVAFSPDGATLALATEGHAVRLSDLQSNAEHETLEGHSEPISAVVFSPDGRLLATASEDGTARVWDVAQVRERVALWHGRPVLDVAFTADGSALVTASGDQVARLWALSSEPWLSWACTILDSRSAHDEDETRRVCDQAPHARIEIDGPQATPHVVDGDGPDHEILVKHGVEYVLVPGGTFVMGSSDDEDPSDERPAHEMTLDGFYIARTELTNAQYALYLAANPDAPKPEYADNAGYNHPDQPVAGLHWRHAKAYCEWAGCSLPTEAQWEYAARAGTTTAYWFGDQDAELTRFAWFRTNSGSRPHSVGKKGSNAFGLYDIAGNLWEWTAETFSDYTTRARRGDGARRQSDRAPEHIIRGGGHEDLDNNLRSANRFRQGTAYWNNDVGLRPVIAVD